MSVCKESTAYGVIWAMICGCTKTAITELIIADMNSVRNAGIFWRRS